MTVNLLDNFALMGTQVVRLNAQLVRSPQNHESLQAKVEMKLSPGEVQQSEKGVFQVGVRLTCLGEIEQEEKNERIFSIEVVLNALYKQVRGDAISFETFSASHGSLTRQIYPLIHHQIMPVLSQLGLYNVRLPHDIMQLPESSKPEQSVDTPKQVH